MDVSASAVTTLLNKAKDKDAREALYRVLEQRLRQIAARHMRSERPDHTLQNTILVDDAFLKLVDRCDWENREQFFCAAAAEVRRRLVDHARARRAAKRGGGQRAAALDCVAEPAANAGSEPDKLLALNEVLEKLERQQPDLFKVFDLHYFMGWELKEIAEDILGIPYVTVRRRWGLAKAFLRRELGEEKEDGNRS